MPYVKQICHTELNPKQAEEAWTDFIHYATGMFDLPTTAFYGGFAEFVSDSHTGGRDIIFVVELGESPMRVRAADENARELASSVMYDQAERGYGDVKVGVLLHHGPCGWGESTDD